MEQGSLRLQIKQDDVADAAVLRCKDLRAAIRLCIETSGLAMKEIAFDLDVKSDHLSRMVNNDGDPRHFPPELIDKLQDICGNEIPLRWQALKRNYGLYRLKSAIEVELDQERTEKEELKRELSILTKYLKEIRA